MSQISLDSIRETWYPRSLTEDVYDNKDRVKFQRDPQDAECLAGVFRNAFRRLDQDKEFLFRTRDDGTLRLVVVNGSGLRRIAI
jgi:hypothetical protein